jgi:hypothetical protein
VNRPTFDALLFLDSTILSSDGSPQPAVPIIASELNLSGPRSMAWTAVEVCASNGPCEYQEEYDRFSRETRRIAPLVAAE